MTDDELFAAHQNYVMNVIDAMFAKQDAPEYDVDCPAPEPFIDQHISALIAQVWSTQEGTRERMSALAQLGLAVAIKAQEPGQ